MGSVDPAILGSSKNTVFLLCEVSSIHLGCAKVGISSTTWLSELAGLMGHTAIRPYEMPVEKTLKIVKASTPTFWGAGFLFCFQGPKKG